MNLQIQSVDLLTAQEKVIRQMLDQQQKEGIIKSDAEYQADLANYMSQVQNGTPTMKLNPQGGGIQWFQQAGDQADNQSGDMGTPLPTTISGQGIIDGDAMTETLEGFNIDIMSTYTAVNMIGDTVSKHKVLNQSVIQMATTQIKKMGDTLDEYEARVGIGGVDQLTVQRFRDTNNFATWSTSLFTDRTGEVYPPARTANLDVELESLTLPTIDSNNNLVGSSGVHLATIKIIKQAGKGLIRITNPAYRIDNAIDESMESAWGETILVDRPFQVEEIFSFITQTGEAQSIKNEFGAICAIQVDFDYFTQLSQVALTPFTRYPMQILAILAFDEESSQWVSVASPFEFPDRMPEYFSDTISYQFPNILTKHVQIILNQIHYTKTDFIVSEKDQRFLDLWFRATGDVIAETPTAYNNYPTYQDMVQMNPGWANLLQEMKKQNMDVEQFVQAMQNDRNVPLSKYQYDYGLYNITMRNNDYDNRGIYISGTIPMTKTVRTARLWTDEVHPLYNGLTQPITDIEYSLTNDGQHWYPILPEGKAQIDCEYLSFDPTAPTPSATLRFAPLAGSSVQVFKDQVLLAAGSDYLWDVSTPQTVLITQYHASSIYTASYTPDPAAQTLDFIKAIPTPPTAIETFEGTDDSGVINLQNNIYLDRAALNKLGLTYNPTYLQDDYLPVHVRLIDSNGRHIDQQSTSSDITGVYVTNVSHYLDPEQKNYLQPFNSNAVNYQYQIAGNQIQFNTPLAKNIRVIVEYNYLVSDLRLRAVLRRNHQEYQSLTPVLNEYALAFETLD